MNIDRRTLLAAALASSLITPSVVRAEDEKAKGDASKEGVPCWGVNRCKGMGDCGAEGCRHSGCSGSNACRRKGFVRLQKETCLKIENGRLTKAAPGAAKETKGK
ncbi:MAG TPA: hypothetical protein VGR00_12225 [Thermoanaerobaculia bacterium]|nr:hypothetical protein [Thermoanaerobaculia bacterium]